MLGVALITLSSISYAFYTVSLRQLMLRGIHPMAVFSGVTLAGTVPILIFAVLLEDVTPLSALTAPEIGIVLALSLVPTLLAYGCYVVALGRMEASRAGAFIFLVPVFSLLLGVLCLGDELAWAQLASSGLIVVGVAVAESDRSRKSICRMKGFETLGKI